MKIFLTSLITILALLFATSASAAEVTFEWDANTEADLAGYKLYASKVSGEYDPAVAIDVGNVVTHKLTDVADGKWHWVLTAYDTGGNESVFSNEVSLTIDTIGPGAPKSFRVIMSAKSVSVEVE